MATTNQSGDAGLWRQENQKKLAAATPEAPPTAPPTKRPVPLEDEALTANLPYLGRLSFDQVDIAAAKTLTKELAFLHQIVAIAFGEDGKTLRIATGDPKNSLTLIDDLPRLINRPIELVVVAPTDISTLLDQIYDQDDITSIIERANEDPPPAPPRRGVMVLPEAPLVIVPGEIEPLQIAQEMLRRCLPRHPSDISVEPGADFTHVRVCIDGHFFELKPPSSIGWHGGVISSLKISAEMNITEKMMPQDGGLCVTYRGKEYNLRLATVPTINGEGMTIRVQDLAGSSRSLAELGFSPMMIERLEKLIRLPYGMLLLTGPTGSGKTGTLYACLNELNEPHRKIITIEDPVEYRLPRVIQLQVDEATGFTFSVALKASLRQGPNVIMVGEIRDVETAETAIRAGLSGHMVFSTLHTKDAVGAVSRLLEMGVKPYLVSSALTAVVAQRLVRKLCHNCYASALLTEAQAVLLGKRIKEGILIETAVGCPFCRKGYQGRTVLAELLVCSEKIAAAILAGRDRNDLLELAVEEGMKTFLDAGCGLIESRVTSVEEVLKKIVVWEWTP